MLMMLRHKESMLMMLRQHGDVRLGSMATCEYGDVSCSDSMVRQYVNGQVLRQYLRQYGEVLSQYLNGCTVS